MDFLMVNLMKSTMVVVKQHTGVTTLGKVRPVPDNFYYKLSGKSCKIY